MVRWEIGTSNLFGEAIRFPVSYRICFMACRSFFIFFIFSVNRGWVGGVRSLTENSVNFFFFLNPSLIYIVSMIFLLIVYFCHFYAPANGASTSSFSSMRTKLSHCVRGTIIAYEAPSMRTKHSIISYESCQNKCQNF